MKLKDLKNRLDELLKIHPQFEELDLIHFDSNFDNFTKIGNEEFLIPVQIHDLKDVNLELVGYFNGDEEDIDNPDIKDINAILLL